MNFPIEIEALILCDEVRREDNGKLLLLGTYAGDVFTEMPATLQLTWFIMGKTPVGGDTDIEFRIETRANNGKHQGEMLAKAALRNNQSEAYSVLILGRIPIPFSEAGEIVLSWKNGEEWQELGKRKVVLNPVGGASSSVPSPLSAQSQTVA